MDKWVPSSERVFRQGRARWGKVGRGWLAAGRDKDRKPVISQVGIQVRKIWIGVGSGVNGKVLFGAVGICIYSTVSPYKMMKARQA